MSSFSLKRIIIPSGGQCLLGLPHNLSVGRWQDSEKADSKAPECHNQPSRRTSNTLPNILEAIRKGCQFQDEYLLNAKRGAFGAFSVLPSSDATRLYFLTPSERFIEVMLSSVVVKRKRI